MTVQTTVTIAVTVCDRDSSDDGVTVVVVLTTAVEMIALSRQR
jgi:hypothetical protein